MRQVGLALVINMNHGTGLLSEGPPCKIDLMEERERSIKEGCENVLSER